MTSPSPANSPMPPPQAPSPMGPPSQSPAPSPSPHSPYTHPPQQGPGGPPGQGVPPGPPGPQGHQGPPHGPPHMQGPPPGAGQHGPPPPGHPGGPYGHPMQHGPPHGPPHGGPQHGPMPTQQHGVVSQHGPPPPGQHGPPGQQGGPPTGPPMGHGPPPHGGPPHGMPQQQPGSQGGPPPHLNGPPGQGPPGPQGHHMPPHHQGMAPHMGMQMPPQGPNMPPMGFQTHGMPPNGPPTGPGQGPPGPPERAGQENLHALQRAIDTMEEKGLQEDPRYTQLLAIRATSKHQHLTSNQINMLRTQITAYRLLARNKPISMQMQQAFQQAAQQQQQQQGPPGPTIPGHPGVPGPAPGPPGPQQPGQTGTPPQCPTPPASPYGQPPGAGKMQPPPHVQQQQQMPPGQIGPIGGPQTGPPGPLPQDMHQMPNGGKPPGPPMMGGGQPPISSPMPATMAAQGIRPPGPAGMPPQGVPKPGAPPPQQPMPKPNRITTVAKPQGLDPIVLLQERENRIASRIALRMQELQRLPATMPEDLRLQAAIELRALRVLNFQRQLRTEIVQCTRRDTTLETAVNIKAYKRTKRQGLREARATEKLEKQQKLEAERKRRQKHQEFLAAVLQHGKDFKEYHRNNKAQLARMNKAIMNYHANAEREQKKEQERIEKERMRRLMAEDEEGYRKLIDQKKDKRLAFLLSQTDEYISNLTQMVKQHKDDQMKKKEDEHKRLLQYKKELLVSGEYINIDDSSVAADLHVTVMEQSTGKKLTGEDGPVLKHLHRWLEQHPGWDWVEDDDNAVNEEEKNQEEKEKQEGEENAKEGDEKNEENALIEDPSAFIKKVKVEDDEYRTEEQTYYSIAHTIHEKVTEQASIMVNGKLKEYQLKGLEWLVSLYNNNLNGILADEMGLGKTIQVIAFLAYLKENKLSKAAHLIVVPSSTLDNWAGELARWCPSLIVEKYHGSQEERRRMRIRFAKEGFSGFDVLLTTYHIVSSTPEERKMFRVCKLHYVIFDEAHMLKNMTTARYSNLITINAEMRILLTGTPLQNNLLELMSLLCFVMPSFFGKNVEDIKSLFGKKNKTENGNEEVSQFQETQVERAKRIMKPFVLRRLKKDVLSNLPKKTSYVEKVTMSESQKRYYNELVDYYSSTRAELCSGDRAGVTIMMEMRKLANHPLLARYYFSDEKLREFSKRLANVTSYKKTNPQYIFEELAIMSDFQVMQLCNKYELFDVKIPDRLILDSGKFKHLDTLLPKLKEEGHRVLIFSQFTMMLDIVERYLTIRKHGFCRLDGSTAVEERQDMINDFNKDSEIFIFLLSTKAGGVGINLTAADTCIIHDIDFNPYNDKQAEDRCHRMGQTRPVSIYRLITEGTIEEGMLMVAEEKLKLEQDITSNEKGEVQETKCVVRLLTMALGLDKDEEEQLNKSINNSLTSPSK